MTKSKLARLIAAVDRILEISDDNAVSEALAAFAPPSPGDIPEIDGVMFLMQLKARAEREHARKTREPPGGAA